MVQQAQPTLADQIEQAVKTAMDRLKWGHRRALLQEVRALEKELGVQYCCADCKSHNIAVKVNGRIVRGEIGE